MTTTRAAECWAHMQRCQREGVPAFPWALDFAQDGYGDLAEACAAVEAVAQQHLDAHPDDHAARRALGEWLTACGDERGEGYRALAACERKAWYFSGSIDWGFFPDDGHYHDACRVSEIPRAWFDLYAPDRIVGRPTRQVAENAAAKAFLQLPPARREQLLKGEM